MRANTDAVQKTTPRMPGRLLLRPLRRLRPLPQRTLRVGVPPTVTQRHAHLATVHAAPVPAPAAAPAPSAVPIASPVAVPPANVLAVRGRFWEVAYGDRQAIVEDCRGLRYIALLIRNAAAGRGPLHAKELVAMATGDSPAPVELTTTDPLLDAPARAQLIARLEELATDRQEATTFHDSSRLALIDEEYERIAEALSEAASGSRSRRGTFNSDAEKARKAVGKAISEAISKLASHPELTELAAHFRSAVHKGLWLSYTAGISWEIDAKL
jgi:hypothetical protein